MKALALAIVLVAMTGCSAITQKAGPQVAKAVNRYCEEPYEIRKTLRDQVNTAIAPNIARVTCVGDPAE